LLKLLGARIVTNIDDLSPADLGEAGLVEERIVAEEKMLFIEQCKNPKASNDINKRCIRTNN